jgi:hypothetical protein
MTDSNLDKNIVSELEGILNKVKFKQAVISLIELVAFIGLLVMFDQLLLGLNFYQNHQTLFRWALCFIALVSLIDVIFVLVKKNKRLSLDNFVEHLNRKDKAFGESAQLLLIESDKLNPLQNVQKQKNIDYFNQSLASQSNNSKRLIPKIKLKMVSYLISIALLLIIFFPLIQNNLIKLEQHIVNLHDRALSNNDNFYEQKNEQVDQQQSLEAQAKLLSTVVKIKPPEYSQLKTEQTTALDIKVLQNSQIEWLFKIKNPNQDAAVSQQEPTYFFIQANGEKQSLIKNAQGLYQYTKKIAQTELYRIGYYQDQQLISLSDSHSIQVNMDQLPKIRLIQPKQSLIEIAKDGKAEIELLVSVKDDFALNTIKILASVAKGSGEAVKFRDKQFDFDQSDYQNHDGHYYKHWTLSELDMEPGDEVYIKVIATDNRVPSPQQSKSSTVIVRWQDENAIETVTEGLQIGFVAEYFRSQRQIIIETEALIADKKDMQQIQIDQISRELGHSQSDLKQRYGQYLGDDFGGGEQDHSHDLGTSLGIAIGNGFGIADGYHGGEEGTGTSTKDIDAQNKVETKSDELQNKNLDNNGLDNNELENKQHQHAQENAGGQEAGSSKNINAGLEPSDITGKAALIAQFAHNHSDFEVGPLSKIDPKSWMKLAVKEMWQAEMHLMLSQPEQALAFEYRAYQYFKQARKAERVYAKRLGFEPPPVDESRRLSGELEDIKPQIRAVIDTNSTAESILLYKSAYQLLSRLSQRTNFEQEDVELLEQLKNNLLILAKSRSVMLQYATKVEKILFAAQLNNSNSPPEDLIRRIDKECSDCVVKLKQKLWQLLPPRKAQASTQTKFNHWPDSIIKAYLEHLENLKQTQGVE